MKNNILIADDHPNILKLLSYNIEIMGYEAVTVNNGEECLQKLKEDGFHAVLLDIDMPKKDGMQTLKEILKEYPYLPVIMITASHDVPTAVKAIKSGAYEYITKPVDFERLEVVLKNALDIYSLRDEIMHLQGQLRTSELFTNIIGQSEQLRRVFQLAGRMLHTDVNVIIIGESGSGKELLAKAIHNGSNRRKGPFVPVNSSAITRELADSLLFGHKKGSFTGANEDRMGYFEQADGGTIFLDEIGDMDIDLQARILRILEEKKVRRVGEKEERKIDFRVIAATNRDLSDFIAQKKFRKDLYFRLEEYPIYLPPLRKRKGDIPLLAKHFLKEFCETNQLEPIRFNPEVIEILKNHPWPGNIRELRNVVRRAALQSADGMIKNVTFSNIDFKIQDVKQTLNIETSGKMEDIVPFEQVERQAIEQAFNAADHNAVEAARILGISRATIYRKLKQFGIE